MKTSRKMKKNKVKNEDKNMQLSTIYKYKFYIQRKPPVFADYKIKFLSFKIRVFFCFFCIRARSIRPFRLRFGRKLRKY